MFITRVGVEGKFALNNILYKEKVTIRFQTGNHHSPMITIAIEGN